MSNLLDVPYSTGPQYQAIATTIVQWISPEHLGCNRSIAADSVGERHYKKPVRRKTRSIIHKALEANRNYAETYNPTLGKRPVPKIAVVTCMDPRLSDLPGILRLSQADIDVPNRRTRGNRRCSREVIVSSRVPRTTEILLLNHIGCGFTTLTDDERNAKLSASTADASPVPIGFFST